MDLNLTGRTVLITGASKGIGAAAAEVFAEEGANLILAARSGEALEVLCQRLRSAHQIQARAGHFWQEDNGPEAARIIADWIASPR